MNTPSSAPPTAHTKMAPISRSTSLSQSSSLIFRTCGAMTAASTPHPVRIAIMSDSGYVFRLAGWDSLMGWFLERCGSLRLLGQLAVLAVDQRRQEGRRDAVADEPHGTIAKRQ